MAIRITKEQRPLLPYNAATGFCYTGDYSLRILGATSYESREWAGFRQWLSLGRVVRAGQHSTVLLMPTATPEGEKQRFKQCRVFNRDQTQEAQRESIAA